MRRPTYDRENVSPVSTDHILMEGIRRVDEWPIIEKRIPTLDFVFRSLVPNKAIKVENASEGESGGLGAAFDGLEGGGNGGSANPTSEVMMNSTEALIYKLLDGKRSILTIMEMTGLSDFDVCRTLFDFMDRNLVAPTGQEQAKTRRQGSAQVQSSAPSQSVGLLALVVVAILTAVGLFISRGAPFRVPTRPSFFRQEATTIDRSLDTARAQRVVSALRSYYLAFGVYPSSLDDLVNASPPLLDANDLRATSGEPFRYDTTASDQVVLEAFGPAGESYLRIVRKILPESVTLSGAPSVGSSNP